MKIKDNFIVRNSRITFTLMSFMGGFILFGYSHWMYGWFRNGHVLQGKIEVSYPDLNYATFFSFFLEILCLAYFSYGIYKVLDRRPQLIFTDGGLWHPKCKFVEWKNVRYLTNEISKDRYHFIKITIKLKVPELELKFLETYIDCNFKVLSEKFNFFKEGHKVE